MAIIQTLDVNDTTHLTIPNGTLDERPVNGTGLIRFNSTLGVLEYSNGTSWIDTQSGDIPYVKNGLVLDFNAGLPQSYTGEGWYDISGNGAFATPTASPSYLGGYFSYNGTTQSHGITKGLPAITGQISVEMWVFLNSNTSPTPVHKGTHFTLQITGPNTYNWADSSNYSYANYGSRTATGIGTTGVWKQIFVTKDTSNNVRVYLNSVLADTRTAFGGPLTDPGTTLWFGGYSDTDTPPASASSMLNGSLAIVRIYNRQLSDAEIVQNYLSSAPVFGGLPAAPTFTATGGTITESGGYRIHTFSTSGNFVITQGSRAVEYLIVAGGGGGGSWGADVGSGGGGGCGGVRPGSTGTLTAGTYPVVVGNGGNPDTNGGNSSFNGIVSTGGGAGNGSSGGSGGGGRWGGGGGAGTAGQGNNGGAGVNQGSGGGGGGAGQAGAAGAYADSPGGKGGDGIQSSIDGTTKYYGGGGGGGRNGLSTGGPGGLGGGGAGAPYNGAATPGTDGLGGGGGGAWQNSSSGGTPARGGNGIVIIRYLI